MIIIIMSPCVGAPKQILRRRHHHLAITIMSVPSTIFKIVVLEAQALSQTLNVIVMNTMILFCVRLSRDLSRVQRWISIPDSLDPHCLQRPSRDQSCHMPLARRDPA